MLQVCSSSDKTHTQVTLLPEQDPMTRFDHIHWNLSTVPVQLNSHHLLQVVSGSVHATLTSLWQAFTLPIIHVNSALCQTKLLMGKRHLNISLRWSLFLWVTHEVKVKKLRPCQKMVLLQICNFMTQAKWKCLIQLPISDQKKVCKLCIFTIIKTAPVTHMNTHWLYEHRWTCRRWLND